MATDLVVNIASQFLGKKAFLDADKATKKLTGSVKNLGRTLGVSLSAAAVLAYGKASVKAASEDIKAQKLLANSLKNVGLAYATVDVEGFISKMQSQTGILDDQLRPAFAKLAGVTGSVAKSEKLMALAFDVSSGSGLDYASTVDLLSQAYIGNTKGLKQLNLGLTQSEIKAMSFDDVMALLNERFAGSGKAALNTYVGQMSLLSASASNASEIIGVSLLGAIDSLTGSDGIANVGTDIENAAKSLANFIDSVVYLKAQIATIPGAGIVKGAFGLIGNVLGRFSPQRAAELLKQIKGPQPFSQPMTLANQDTGRATSAAAAKAENAAKKRAAELLATQKKTLKSQQDALKLAKARATFDLQKIQIEAALKGKISEEDRLRLKLMQAIEDENISQIELYQGLLDKAQQSTEKLVSTLQSIKPLDDVFRNWSFMGVKDQLASLEGYFKDFVGSAASAFNSLGAAQRAALGGFVPFQGATNASLGITSNAGTMTSLPSTVGLGTSGTGNQLPAGVTVNVTAGVVGDENIIVDAVQNALNEIARRGYLTTYAGALPV